jgi:plastocyanin
VEIPALGRIAVAVLCITGSCAFGNCRAGAQDKLVTLHVKIQNDSSKKAEKASDASQDASEVVVWLKPLDPADNSAAPAADSGKRPQVIQKHKSFHPHLTVVRVGSVVDFPNHDPFFHNVFSLYDGKRFDLGLYEAGATNSVRFDHVGISYLFCNIHPEMSAVVVALDTPYFGETDKSGRVGIAAVPDGKYELHVWYEKSVPEALKALARTVHITGDSRDLGTIVVPQDPAFTPTHKNKYGQDYAPPPKQGYPQP